MMQPQTCPAVEIQCEINGKPYSYAVSPTMSLLHFLRGQGLISVKEGCSVGECGACTVRVNGTAIDSCLYLAVWADGKSIRTVEGERKGNELSDVQQAFIDEGGGAMRFLHPGSGDGERRPARQDRSPSADRGGNPPRPVGQPLPLYRLSERGAGGEEVLQGVISCLPLR